MKYKLIGSLDNGLSENEYIFAKVFNKGYFSKLDKYNKIPLSFLNETYNMFEKEIKITIHKETFSNQWKITDEVIINRKGNWIRCIHPKGFTI